MSIFDYWFNKFFPWNINSQPYLNGKLHDCKEGLPLCDFVLPPLSDWKIIKVSRSSPKQRVGKNMEQNRKLVYLTGSPNIWPEVSKPYLSLTIIFQPSTETILTIFSISTSIARIEASNSTRLSGAVGNSALNSLRNFGGAKTGSWGALRLK